MRCLIVVVALLFAVQGRNLSDQEAWEQFKIEHGKTYRSLLEDQHRFSVFQSNLRSIEEHNKRYARGEESFSMKINQFGDLTKEEFQATLMVQRPELDETLVKFPEAVDLPDSVDWRKKGAVTEVRNQGLCNSCWAFSTVGALEGQIFLKNKTLEPLSPQNLIDCAVGDYQNIGCRGGFVTEAFGYVRDHGIFTEKEYPYKQKQGTCLKQGGVKISTFALVPQGNETALIAALATKGPISTTVDVAGFQFYYKGMVDNSHCRNTYDAINHAILLVGYENGHYIAKNSWGPGWGDNGYLNILMNNNTCGVALYDSYPIL